jgi:hypothetical protein
MSAQPNADRPAIEELLGEVLHDAERLDRTLDTLHAEVREMRDHLRGRLYALRLGDDAAFRADVDQLAEDLEAGKTPPTFSLEEVLESQG